MPSCQASHDANDDLPTPSAPSMPIKSRRRNEAGQSRALVIPSPVPAITSAYAGHATMAKLAAGWRFSVQHALIADHVRTWWKQTSRRRMTCLLMTPKQAFRLRSQAVVAMLTYAARFSDF